MSGEYFAPNEGPRDRAGSLLYGVEVTRSLLEQAIVVGVAAVKIPTTPLTNRKTLTIQNLSANMVYVGSSTVTTLTGIELLPKAAITIRVEDSVDVYAIATGVGSDVRCLEGA